MYDIWCSQTYLYDQDESALKCIYIILQRAVPHLSTKYARPSLTHEFDGAYRIWLSFRHRSRDVAKKNVNTCKDASHHPFRRVVVVCLDRQTRSSGTDTRVWLTLFFFRAPGASERERLRTYVSVSHTSLIPPPHRPT